MEDGGQRIETYPLSYVLNSPSSLLLLFIFLRRRVVFQDAMDRFSGEFDLGVVGLVHLDEDLVVAGFDDGADDAADRLHAVAALEVAEHVLDFAFLVLLAAA